MITIREGVQGILSRMKPGATFTVDYVYDRYLTTQSDLPCPARATVNTTLNRIFMDGQIERVRRGVGRYTTVYRKPHPDDTFFICVDCGEPFYGIPLTVTPPLKLFVRGNTTDICPNCLSLRAAQAGATSINATLGGLSHDSRPQTDSPTRVDPQQCSQYRAHEGAT
jgi:hypothetical protein